MPFYRKKPVTIEARQVTKESILDVAKWCQGQAKTDESIEIETLEGTHRADLLDWVIKGVHGEFYPCKPDIFEKTYDFLGTNQGNTHD